jgi:hypothetical protein
MVDLEHVFYDFRYSVHWNCVIIRLDTILFCFINKTENISVLFMILLIC